MGSQLGQDGFVLSYFKKGFYIDVGAADPVSLSNTWLLDRLGWEGVCVDPLLDEMVYRKVKRRARLEKVAITRKSGVCRFLKCLHRNLSVLEEHKDGDKNSGMRRKKGGEVLEVEGVSLDDFLCRVEAPKFIEYMSIDIEGAEFSILEDFSWKWEFGVMTLEYNYGVGVLKKLKDLLGLHGYFLKRVVLWDLWFVNENIELLSNK